jgi:hypothetical protein
MAHQHDLNMANAKWVLGEDYTAAPACATCHKSSGDPAKIKGAEALEAELQALLARPEHAWYTGNLSKKEIEKRGKAQEEFNSRYQHSLICVKPVQRSDDEENDSRNSVAGRCGVLDRGCRSRKHVQGFGAG